ncbi:hypothetical protein B0J13DRAFT_52601 [Dactylonectria estremocensis]|uniref:Oxidoreductase NAD-binding domain-containing protein 1 n=1 Tax=Dactylonectria estremocensis TaxID=1079267 RepID=A0A9P9J2T4_9HYPO|nr:hypothetical protein B0J13DRAFT_52601 [Dactylonectria estremocensis]
MIREAHILATQTRPIAWGARFHLLKTASASIKHKAAMTTDRTGHLERTAQEPRDESLHTVTLSRVDQVNERVRLIRLSLQSPISFAPGQWLDTYVPDTAKPGGFTLTSPPSAAAAMAPSPYLELAVQASPENPAAAWLWRPVPELLGSTLGVRVGGSFVFPPAGTPGPELRRVVLVAGGVGINPLMSMMSAMADDGFSGDVQLLYAAKVAAGGLAEVLFVPRIAALFRERRLRGRPQVFATDTSSPASDLVHDLGDELNKAQFEIHVRRFGPDDLKGAVGHDRDSCLVYVCGPPTMTDEVVGILTSADGVGLEERQVMTEKWW